MIDEKKNLVESQGWLLDERKNLVKDQGYVIDEKKNLVEYQGGINPPILEEINMIKQSFSFSDVIYEDNSNVSASEICNFLKSIDTNKIINITLQIDESNNSGSIPSIEKNTYSVTTFEYNHIDIVNMSNVTFIIQDGYAENVSSGTHEFYHKVLRIFGPDDSSKIYWNKLKENNEEITVSYISTDFTLNFYYEE